jgi:hypothetical protein
MWWISERHAVLGLRVLAASSALAACAAMLWYGRSASALFSWFALWVLAPSAAAYALSVLMPSSYRAWPLLALVGGSLAFGPVMYVLVALGRPDAQDALIFVVAPIWQLLGIAVSIIGAVVLGAARALRKSKP